MQYEGCVACNMGYGGCVLLHLICGLNMEHVLLHAIWGVCCCSWPYNPWCTYPVLGLSVESELVLRLASRYLIDTEPFIGRL